MTQQIQIGLEPAKIFALDVLAAHSGKRREELIAHAVEDLLALEQHNLDAIHEGLADAEAGRVTPHEEMLPLIQSLREARRHSPAAVSFAM
jgi:predicted transcriptional regulator